MRKLPSGTTTKGPPTMRSRNGGTKHLGGGARASQHFGRPRRERPFCPSRTEGSKRPRSHRRIEPDHSSLSARGRNSFAAPIVASANACMLEANPGLAPLLVRDVLKETAHPVPGAGRERQGARALSPGQAVARD